MCTHHKELLASEERVLPPEARGMDKVTRLSNGINKNELHALHERMGECSLKASKFRNAELLGTLSLLNEALRQAHRDNNVAAFEEAKVLISKAETMVSSLGLQIENPNSVEKAPEVSDDVKSLRDRIRERAKAILADEARLPTGRVAKFERKKFREETLLKFSKGLVIELPTGEGQFAEAASILRAKLLENFGAQEAEKLMPKFLRNTSEL